MVLKERSSETLLKVFDSATAEDPIVLSGNEPDHLAHALKQRNRATYKDSSHYTFWNKEVHFNDGPIFSHVDCKRYSNATDWKNHLKANGCVEVGNDKSYLRPKKRELQGDFNCRKELTEATKHVLRGY